MPGQVASLQKRLALLAPERERCLGQLSAATEEARTLADGQQDPGGAGRALKRAARLRTELASITGEIATLESLVAARMGRTATR